jgi:restriction endonuclease S subunit
MKALVPNPRLLDSDFLAYLLESHQRLLLSNYVKRGATVHSLQVDKLRKMPIPLPPLSEQRRIVEILDQADALRKKRAEADAKAARILPALFYEMFGDPATNPKGWPIRHFESICDSRLGKMLDAKQQTGQHQRPYLRDANVYWDHLELDSILEMDFDEADRDEFRLEKGDVLICEGGEVGRCAIWDDDLPECYFQKALHRARPMEGTATSEFVLYLLRELAQNGSLMDAVSKMTFAHLTGVKLKALRIPVPPVSLQEKFSSRVRGMKFLCLNYGDEKRWNALPTSTREALLAQDELLRSRGDLVAEVQAPTTVKFENGHAQASDGAFGQAPLPLAGFYVIEAGDMDEAIGLLSKTPCAHAGAYELRPLS